jgi:hypothetical protein
MNIGNRRQDKKPINREGQERGGNSVNSGVFHLLRDFAGRGVTDGRI